MEVFHGLHWIAYRIDLYNLQVVMDKDGVGKKWLDHCMVEAAGIEPASVSTLPLVLHAYPNIRFNYLLSH
jgi:hypothetical protein